MNLQKKEENLLRNLKYRFMKKTKVEGLLKRDFTVT